MIEWKVEEMKLLNNDMEYVGKLKGMSIEDKVKFIDQFQNGKMSEVLRLIDLYQVDSQNGVLKFDVNRMLPKVKNVSLKAWLIKNDKMKLCDNFYKYGHCYFLHDEYIQCGLSKEKAVNVRLDIEISELQRKERVYFVEHDEQCVLERNLQEFIGKYGNMGFQCTTGSQGLKFGTFEESRKFTIDEMKFLISQYETLENFKGELAKEIEEDLKY